MNLDRTADNTMNVPVQRQERRLCYQSAQRRKATHEKEETVRGKRVHTCGLVAQNHRETAPSGIAAAGLEDFVQGQRLALGTSAHCGIQKQAVVALRNGAVRRGRKGQEVEKVVVSVSSILRIGDVFRGPRERCGAARGDGVEEDVADSAGFVVGCACSVGVRAEFEVLYADSVRFAAVCT